MRIVTQMHVGHRTVRADIQVNAPEGLQILKAAINSNLNNDSSRSDAKSW